MKKKKVRWHSLQVELIKRMYDRLKEEFRTAEYEMQVCICEPEQGSLMKMKIGMLRKKLLRVSRTIGLVQISMRIC